MVEALGAARPRMRVVFFAKTMFRRTDVTSSWITTAADLDEHDKWATCGIVKMRYAVTSAVSQLVANAMFLQVSLI